MDKQQNGDDNSKVHKFWKCLTITLGILCVVIIIVMIVIIAMMNRKKDPEEIKECYGHPASGAIDLTETDVPHAFRDLTRKEIQTIMDFMYSQKELNLTDPEKTTIASNYIYSVELVLPEKTDVIQPRSGTPVRRRAMVTVFQGGKPNPDVAEYYVDITTSPQLTLSRKPIPFSFRPITWPEYNIGFEVLKNESERVVGDILHECFDGSFSDCGNKCLGYFVVVPYAAKIAGIRGKSYRGIWYPLAQLKESAILHPVNFFLLLRMDGTAMPKPSAVWYNNKLFDSLQSFKEKWNNGEVNKIRVDFPTSHTHHEIFPEYPQRPPIEVEPDGKRYTIKDKTVSYMNWKFHFGISPTHGPQLYQIKFKNIMIAYEIGLQEMSVFYSSQHPLGMFANYFDSVAMLGRAIRSMVPGVDCPRHATYIDSVLMSESSRAPVTEKNAICIFEHNTGIPLRRHHAPFEPPSGYYDGTPNTVLILRMITTFDNYDYIFDFIFYQNGAFETKVHLTGIVLGSPLVSERKYGFQIHDRSIGTIHHHLFHFKVDLDIGGPINSYSTHNIVRDSVPNNFSKDKNPDKWYQEKIVQVNYATEREAAYKFNFSNPKYLIFYSENENDKNKFGHRKGYRLVHRGMSKSVLPEGYGNEPGASWMRYQMAVTKRKESEPHSSSKYATYDGEQPTVDFESFIGDENIQGEDLVAWITLGKHHIPRSEDVPFVTTSPGGDLSFVLLPFNFFDEDPSTGSRDNVRIHYEKTKDPRKFLKVERRSKTEDLHCLPPKTYSIEDLTADPEAFIIRH
ncbi:putative amine oxidase [copper-containing] [Ostrea edulis]|uniref:putative amine oxidase [copper-containing] n=1 Tax=Ostrea edulis TaxID=37623 RepID=UPI0024AEDE16|nr:putative amine oxidase [copper-containing] [Ostrea edulis]